MHFFPAHYQQEQNYSLLQRASFCGADKIGEYLLERCEFLKNNAFILSYTASSPNEE